MSQKRKSSLVGVFLGGLAVVLLVLCVRVWADDPPSVSDVQVAMAAPSASPDVVELNGKTTITVSAQASAPMTSDPEASIGQRFLAFTWVNAKMVSTKPDANFDWSTVAAADASTYTQDLDSTPTTTTSATFNFTPKAAGYWHLTVSAAAIDTETRGTTVVMYHNGAGTSPNAGLTLTAVEIDRIIVDDTSPEVTSPVTLPLGKSLMLRAMPKPDTAFPDGTPTWEFTETPGPSTASLSVRASPTASIKPDYPGDYVVQATCGSSEKIFRISVPYPQVGEAVEDARKSNPDSTTFPSESFYDVSIGEMCEVGGTFQFQMRGGTSDSPRVFWEWWDVDGLHSLKATGSGGSFNRTLSNNDEGYIRMRFYADWNCDGEIEDTEPRLWSPVFQVVPVNVCGLSVEASTAILPPGYPTLTQVQAKLDDACGVGNKRDSQEDYRACIKLTASSLATFTPAVGIRPDPCLTSDAVDLHFNSSCDLVLVQDMTAVGIVGRANFSKHRMVVALNAAHPREILHEFGHLCGFFTGLGHDDTSGYVMHQPPDGDLLRRSQAEVIYGGH